MRNIHLMGNGDGSMDRSELEEIKGLMENREVKEVTIGYDGKLVVIFKDGGWVSLSQNSFREWYARGR